MCLYSRTDSLTVHDGTHRLFCAYTHSRTESLPVHDSIFRLACAYTRHALSSLFSLSLSLSLSLSYLSLYFIHSLICALHVYALVHRLTACTCSHAQNHFLPVPPLTNSLPVHDGTHTLVFPPTLILLMPFKNSLPLHSQTYSLCMLPLTGSQSVDAPTQLY